VNTLQTVLLAKMRRSKSESIAAAAFKLVNETENSIKLIIKPAMSDLIPKNTSAQDCN